MALDYLGHEYLARAFCSFYGCQFPVTISPDEAGNYRVMAKAGDAMMLMTEKKAEGFRGDYVYAVTETMKAVKAADPEFSRIQLRKITDLESLKLMMTLEIFTRAEILRSSRYTWADFYHNEIALKATETPAKVAGVAQCTR